MENSALRQTTVILATAPVNSQLDVFYVHSLSDTIKQGAANGINFVPVFIPNERYEATAKNELLNIAYVQEADSIVFLRNDIAWDAWSLVQLVQSNLPVAVLPTVVKKSGNLIYDIDFDKTNLEYNDQGYLKVTYASSACMKLERSVIQALYDKSVSVINESGNEVKNVFETQTEYGRFSNEDVVLCNKLKDLNIDIWALPNTTCAQNTVNLYSADFPGWLNSIIHGQKTPEDIKSLYE
jgi:hypothetical protein